MRGGLQAVYSVVELLSRAAMRGGADPARVDHMTGLAKRAMANQEESLLAIISQLTLAAENPSEFDVANLLTEVQQFLRNDTANKEIRLEIHAGPGLMVVAPRARLRCLFTGLIVLSIDVLPAGSLLRVDLTHVGTDAVLEIRSEASFGALRTEVDLLRIEGRELLPQNLVLNALQRCVRAADGRVELASGTDRGEAARAAAVLRVVLPAAAANLGQIRSASTPASTGVTR